MNEYFVGNSSYMNTVDISLACQQQLICHEYNFFIHCDSIVTRDRARRKLSSGIWYHSFAMTTASAL